MELPSELLETLSKATGITFNSKEVEEGYLFFAVKGTRYDGHDFVGEALKRGALKVVVERDVNVPADKKILVKDTRKALALCANLFFGKPSSEMKVTGVTGTNGKTTTTYILEKIFSRAGQKVGILGTISYRVGREILGEGRTTPDPITWFSVLKKMKDIGARRVVAEVSSHALDQDRIWSTEFEGVIFTNLTRDHLDYHGDMESYFKAKRRLFTEYDYRFAVVNADCPYGERLIKELGDKVISYGKKGNLRIETFETSLEGSRLVVSFEGEKLEVQTNLVGDFQAYNLAAGIAYALRAGVDQRVISEALREIHVPGRFEVYRSEGFVVVVDYAHTPDAIRNVLETLKKLAYGRVIAVFGAGGDRDRGKRPLMGKYAEELSDLIVLTSDNPRSEDPMKIIDDILSGISEKRKVIIEPDRKKAIETAINLACKGDVVAVLGKGHEDYQEIKGIRYPFSDSQVIKELLGI